MSIQFEPSEKQAVTQCDVIINGRKRGRVFSYKSDMSNHKFQCQLHFKGQFMPGGFGVTMEDSVKDATQKAIEQLKEIIADVDAFLVEIEES